MIINFEADIYNRLISDGALMAILTGGLFNSESMALSRASVAGITNSMRQPDGTFKPFGYVHGRDVIATDEIADNETQFTTAEQTVEIWILDDPVSTPVAMKNASARLYRLMQNRPPTGAFECQLVFNENYRDLDFNNARLSVSEWLLTASIGG